MFALYIVAFVVVYFYCSLIMAALCNRAGHYIFALWFLSFFFFCLFSSSNLSGRRLDVYHTSTHGVALVRITFFPRLSVFFFNDRLEQRDLRNYKTNLHQIFRDGRHVGVNV